MNKKVISIIAIIALVAVLGVCLIACNADTYAKRLEKAGYKVEVVDLSDEDKEEGVIWAVSAAKTNSITDVQIVAVTKYASADEAKKAEEDAKANNILNVTIERQGAILIIGTEQGVKDAK
ncbi:MAG: hypothetical protein IKD35_01810 [Clostridia bacterium]|nr:hypothetical protein [Clostridia bacterium]